MFGDGGRAGVVALFGQRLAQPHDAVFDLGVDRVSMAVRAPGARLKRSGPVGVVTADQLVYPVPRQPVVAGDLAFAAPFEHDGGNDQLRLRHGRPPTTTEVSTMSRDIHQLSRGIRHSRGHYLTSADANP